MTKKSKTLGNRSLNDKKQRNNEIYNNYDKAPMDEGNQYSCWHNPNDVVLKTDT